MDSRDWTVEDLGDSVRICGVRYSKALFEEWGIKGIETGTFFQLLNRDSDGAVTIKTYGENPLVKAKREGMEDAAKIADDYGCDCEHAHCHDSHDIRNLILSRAQEVK